MLALARKNAVISSVCVRLAQNTSYKYNKNRFKALNKLNDHIKIQRRNSID